MIENYQCDSIIKLKGEVTTMYLLKNKKDVAVCTTIGFLEIYDIKLFKKKLSIELIRDDARPINETILDIIEFKDNKFCLSCWDNTIKVIELYDNNKKYKILQTLNGHKGNVNSLRKLFFYQNEIIFASSSTDGVIIFWKYENENFNKFKEIDLYENEPLNEGEEYNHQIESIEESIKYQELICGNYSLEEIHFLNLNNTLEIEKMDINVNRCIRALKIIDNGDTLIIAGNNEINLFNLENKSILFSIKYGVECEFNCIYQKHNGNILITEYRDICKIKEFQFDKKKLTLNVLSMKEKDFTNYITTIIELDNGNLIIGGYDKTFKLFREIKNNKKLNQ